MADDEAQSERHDEVRSQADDVPTGLVLRLLGATVVIAATLCVVAYLLLVARESQLRPGRRFPERELGPPRDVANVRTTPFELLEPAPTLGEQQRARLERFEWIDEQRRIVRIPVDRAAELMLREASGAPEKDVNP